MKSDVLKKGRIGFAVAAIAVLAAMTVGVPSASAHGDKGEVVRVKMIDRCDPVTFNAALGPDACAPLRPFRNPVTFAQLIASADPVNHTASNAWRFSPRTIEIEEGDTIRATNVGGEGHSFTEVPFFGGGCVQQVNDLIGFSPTDVAANCPADFAGVRPPGGSADITGLSAGEHKFICVIHPWMRATVEVEGDKDHRGHGD